MQDGNPRLRQLGGVSGFYADCVLTFIPVTGIIGILDVPSYFGLSLHLSQYIAIMFGLILCSAFLIMPVKKRSSLDEVPWYDLLFSIGSIGIGLYVAIYYQTIMVDIGMLMPQRVALGAAAVLLTLEASRRVVGLAFIIIIIAFIFYAIFGSYFPGVLYTKSISIENLVTFLYLDPQGILGTPLSISATIVFVFVLFGQLISTVGVSKLFNDLAFAVMGRFRGGPAKVAVLSSSLFGMISGSAVANVVTTGVFTIPLMKKAGYKPYFAGAVEAVASTGGQIMPPIMGAAAFLMATFIGVPYSTIALAAAFPAILYYTAVFVQVDLRAGKDNLRGLPRKDLPRIRAVLRENWPFFIPLLALIYTLFILLMEAEYSGLISFLVTGILGFILKKKTGMSIRRLAIVLRDTGKGLLEIGITSAGAGLIIGVLSITGLAFTFSSVLVSLAMGNLFLLLLLAAIGTTILGMGMTVTACYLLMVVLTAPALSTMGVPLIVAHFFVFYYGVLSFLTPPVCLAAYAGASIAGANMNQTAFQSMKLGIVAYLVPFICVYNPALLLIGRPATVLWACITSFIGVCIMASGVEGFLFRKLDIWKRVALVVGGLGITIPGIRTDIIGFCIAFPVIYFEWRAKKEEAKRVSQGKILF